MSEPRPEPKADGALANVSPLASAFAVAAGFAAYWLVTGLSMQALASLFPADFPMPTPGSDELPRPTDRGLSFVVAAMALNGTVAGLLAGRLAPVAPVVHAALLAAVFGMYALTGMGQAHGFPGWFALAFALVPPAAAVLGGVLARHGRKLREARARPVGAATVIASSDDERGP